jgi:hypothetical protein
MQWLANSARDIVSDIAEQSSEPKTHLQISGRKMTNTGYYRSFPPIQDEAWKALGSAWEVRRNLGRYAVAMVRK